MFTLETIVPWGRSFEEYLAMFSLADNDLEGRILGCGDGPAGFQAEASRRGLSVISCDPIYAFTKEEIASRIAATYTEVIEQTRRNPSAFVWDRMASVEELGRVRMAAMQAFLEDYPAGLLEGRYVNAELPVLPFSDHRFDLALCSHLLFLYSRQLDAAFHQASLLELTRVAHEVRVFPLLELGGTVSPHLAGQVEGLRAAGFRVSVERVGYEFQRGACEMLRIQREDG